jgi:glyoxylase-like metal-dependent hydrolase (beta-lactamase superfamily II)
LSTRPTTPAVQEHVHHGFRGHAGEARLRPIDRDTTVAPGVTAVLTPGHTPGHLCVVLASDAQRALLLGDAITCPVQLDEPTWHSIGDIDPDLANRTRGMIRRRSGPVDNSCRGGYGG